MLEENVGNGITNESGSFDQFEQDVNTLVEADADK
jgi:hypothetical protein